MTWEKMAYLVIGVLMLISICTQLHIYLTREDREYQELSNAVGMNNVITSGILTSGNSCIIYVLLQDPETEKYYILYRRAEPASANSANEIVERVGANVL